MNVRPFLRSLAGIALLQLLQADAFAAAPPNDNFANRIPLSGKSVQTTGTNVDATQELGEPFHWLTTGGKSVWWSWVAPVSGPVTVTTVGSDFDTLLAIYTGSAVNGLTLINNNDDTEGVQSTVQFDAVANVTYQIAVDGYGVAPGTSTGNIQLNIDNASVTTLELIPWGSIWRFRDNGSDQGTAWIESGFDDSGWGIGIGQLGFGDGDESSFVNCGPSAPACNSGNFATTYFRTTFVVPNPAQAQSLNMSLLFDDGGIVYLNGVEVLRTRTMPFGAVTYQTYCSTSGDNETTSTSVPVDLLLPGLNTLAVEIHQSGGTSSDLSFDLQLSGAFETETNRAPFVSIVSPANGTIFGTPANISFAVDSFDAETVVTNVEFYADSTRLGQDAAAPYAFQWNNVPVGTYALRAVAVDDTGLISTSAPVNVTVSANTTPPVISARTPVVGAVTNLTQIAVSFSKPVFGVNAGDLLVNGTPATGVFGGGSDYVFTFPQPAYGMVSISWAANHGISDGYIPPNAFNAAGVGATWSYQLNDTVPPGLAAIDPATGTTVPALTSIQILFSEPVTGVNAGDLRINSSPASGVSGSGAGPYSFSFVQPAQGAVQVGWAPGHGIHDLSGNAYLPTSWSYVLDTNASGIVVSEIMYQAASGDPREEYIELYNRGGAEVDLSGWRLRRGVDFTFPTNTVLRGGAYLVVAADRQSFTDKYPGVTNVVGSWLIVRTTNVAGVLLTDYENKLSNTRNTIELENAAGQRINRVSYADEGDWAVRQRGVFDGGFRGWTWKKEADGLGKSLELITHGMPNEYGQNWAASVAFDGTPGRANSVARPDTAPLIIDVKHFPLVPKSTETVSISARILDEVASSTTVALHWRVDAFTPPAFAVTNMVDDGLHGDGAAGDGIYGAVLPAMPNNTVVEFYVRAVDTRAQERTWPGPVLEADDSAPGNLGQVANALYQVDDTTYSLNRPLYKMILRAAEYSELGNLLNGAPNSDATMNGTFISLDGTETLMRYRCGIRNRGHGSRFGSPHNYLVEFPSDQPWKGVTRLNLNARSIHAQHFGSVLLQKAGAVGGNSLAVQFRLNNNAGPGGTPTFGLYAANEPVDGEWASNHYPSDGGGNVYRAIRDINPPDFDYRTFGAYPGLFGPDDPRSYNFTFFKHANTSLDDWSDLIGMLRVMGPNGTTPFTAENVRQVINVEQWLTHLAVMALVDNRESGLNTGFNDDYYLYRGVNDPRFILSYHDIDTILNEGDSGGSTTASIFGATSANGSGQAFNRFMRHPEFEPIYYATLQRLIDTVFAPVNFDPLIEQTLGDYVPVSVINRMKTWNANRVAFVRNTIAGLVPPTADPATLTGEPRSPTPLTSATLTVGGQNIVAYRYKLNNGAFGAETPVGTPISLTGLANGSSNLVYVIGRNEAGFWQDTNSATISRPWIVNTAWSRVRLNEILVRNDSAVNHQGTYPDLIELFNEGATAVDLSGLRLTDDPTNPDKFTFPAGVTLGAGSYLVVYANNPDGTPGLHAGFSLDQNGEGVFLYDRTSSGGALLDSVTFGPQLTDLSIGRVNGGTWQLTKTTFGAVNAAQGTASPAGVKINEWLAAPLAPFSEDFIELHNPAGQPVDLGGLYLTDNAIGAPRCHAIAPLTFIDANGYLSFTADGNAGAGATHLSFGLAAEQGSIALLNSSPSALDWVSYGAQRSGISQGRCPSGGTNIISLPTPTPGGPNLCPPPPPGLVTVPLVPFEQVWRYDQTTDHNDGIWMTGDYSDAAWPTGQGVLGSAGTGSLSQPIRTPLTLGRITYYFRTTFFVPPDASLTSLQLTHLFDDGAVVYLNEQEVFRYNMPTGLVNSSTLATTTISGTPSELGPTSIPRTSLNPGFNLLAVEVHQSAANSSDVYMGLKLDGVIITNTPSSAGLVINEVLADNASLAEPDGSTPDWVELYNPSASAIDLTDMSFSDSTTNPRRWVFPAGTILPARGYHAVRFDSDAPASATNTGFGLKTTGDALYLFDGVSRGGGVLDFVAFGLQVPDLSIGRFPNGGSNWSLTLPSRGSANLAAPLGDPALLKVNEWLADPGPGDDDWFEIYNASSQAVSIGGFYFTDTLNQTTKYRPVPALSFIGAGSNAWQRIWADGNIDAGADHVEFSLRAAGEAVGIANASGALIDAVSFGAQTEKVSEGRLPDGATNVLRFPVTASPGDPNYLLLTNVVINEILAHSDLPLEDAIELRNLSGETVNIGGWFISDSKSNLRKFIIPDGTTIAPNGFKVFYEYQFNNSDTGAPFSFSSAKGDTAYLSQSGANGQFTGYRSVAKFGPSENGVSFGRYVNSVGDVQFPAMSALSFGTAVNAQSPTNQITVFRTGAGAANPYPKVGPVVISEIAYRPPPVVVPGVSTNDNVIDEFIELHNFSVTDVPLYDPGHPTNTWRLRDAVDFEFAPYTVLPAGGYLLVVSFDPINDLAGRTTFQARYGTNSVLVGPYRGKLDNDGESVKLYKPDAPQAPGTPDAGIVPYILVERVDYDKVAPWPADANGTGPSLQRVSLVGFGNDPTNWVAALPTPGPGGVSQFDSDGDGMPNSWEDQFGFDKFNSADANQDADLDGMTNVQEFRAGTDPRNGASALQLIATVNGAVVELRFTGIAGKTYTVQYSTTLPAGAVWQKLTDVPATGVSQQRMVTDSHSGAQKFYRVITPSVP